MQPADCDFITSVVNNWWGGRPVQQLLPRLFFEHFNSSSYALMEDAAIIGFLIGFRSQSQPHVAYIHFVGVDPQHRNKGLARSLYLRFFDQMKSLGCNEAHCITAPANTASIAFHTQMGFEIIAGDEIVDTISVHRNHAGTGQHRVVFRKLLT